MLRRKRLVLVLVSILIVIVLGSLIVPKVINPYYTHLAQLNYNPGWRERVLSRAAIDRRMFEDSFAQMPVIADDWSKSDYKFHLNDNGTAQIPKVIWTYWRGSLLSMSDIIQRCMQTWKESNPEYEIRLVSSKNIHEFIPKDAPPECQLPPGFNELESYLQADWLRLTLLRLHGGIWLDASTILTGSLDFIQSYKGSTEGFMYVLNGLSSHLPKFPLLENWFISSIPNGDFITKWQKEFDFVVRNFGSNGFAYVAHLEETFGHDKVRSLVQYLPYEFEDYLKAHIAAQKVMQINGAKSISTQEASEGPLKFIDSVGWRRRRMASKLNEPIVETPPVIIKLRALERESSEWYIKLFKIRKDSIYSRYLKY